MAADVETMFSTREKPWHGLGTIVAEAPDSREALTLAGLDWKVIQKKIYTGDRKLIHGDRANVRDSDHQFLGVVSDRYRVVQNEDAFAFTDRIVFKSSMFVLRNKKGCCRYGSFIMASGKR